MNKIEQKHEDVCMADFGDTTIADHAAVTKDVAVGFSRWTIEKGKMKELFWIDELGKWRYFLDFFTEDELYDFYIDHLTNNT